MERNLKSGVIKTLNNGQLKSQFRPLFLMKIFIPLNRERSKARGHQKFGPQLQELCKALESNGIWPEVNALIILKNWPELFPIYVLTMQDSFKL